MKKEDIKEVILQVLEFQLDYQLRAIRRLQGKPETELVLAHHVEEDVSLSSIFPFKY